MVILHRKWLPKAGPRLATIRSGSSLQSPVTPEGIFLVGFPTVIIIVWSVNTSSLSLKVRISTYLS